jgi:DeoR/GlpR family transcriptional regulator of sugar metabolism
MDNKRQLSNVERQDEIWRFVQTGHRVTVADLCEQFSASKATARRDLGALVEQKTIQRLHGGAIAGCQPPPELPALQRSSEQADEKKRIGLAAANLVIVRSIDPEHGLTNDHLPETMTDRAILGIGREVVIVADTATPPDFADVLASKGIRVLTV